MSGQGGSQRATPEASGRERAADAAALGLRGSLSAGEAAGLAALVGGDPDARVRGAALGALARHPSHADALAAAWRSAVTDADAGVRRRALEVAPSVPGCDAEVVATALGDGDPLVAEAAAFALGELGTGAAALAEVGTSHREALVREAAVAALGAVGDEVGLPAVLTALQDRPQVRRRAVLALAAFDGPEVEAALERATHDRDWQVRQAASELGRQKPE